MQRFPWDPTWRNPGMIKGGKSQNLKPFMWPASKNFALFWQFLCHKLCNPRDNHQRGFPWILQGGLGAKLWICGSAGKLCGSGGKLWICNSGKHETIRAQNQDIEWKKNKLKINFYSISGENWDLGMGTNPKGKLPSSPRVKSTSPLPRAAHIPWKVRGSLDLLIIFNFLWRLPILQAGFFPGWL